MTNRNMLGSEGRERIIDLGTILAGAWHGYCDRRGYSLSNDLELALTFGPAIFRSGYNAVKGAQLSKEDVQAGNRVKGFSRGALFGAILGGAETAVGYGVGYLIGHILETAN